MVTYFKPWRRKFGVVTLVIACVLAAGWVRSLMVLDSFYSINPQFRASYQGAFCVVFHSHGGWVSGWLLGGTETRSDFTRPNWHRIPAHKAKSFENTRDDLSWKALVVGVGFGTPSTGNPLKRSIWYFRYSSIVIPLTLLSAWLLLSKVRKKVDLIQAGTISN
jgi:hypothetical protein